MQWNKEYGWQMETRKLTLDIKVDLKERDS